MKAQKHGPSLNVHDYKKDKYTAYFEIFYNEDEGDHRYSVNFYDYATSKIVANTEGKRDSLIEAKSDAQSWAIEQIEKFRRD